MRRIEQRIEATKETSIARAHSADPSQSWESGGLPVQCAGPCACLMEGIVAPLSRCRTFLQRLFHRALNLLRRLSARGFKLVVGFHRVGEVSDTSADRTSRGNGPGTSVLRFPG